MKEGSRWQAVQRLWFRATGCLTAFLLIKYGVKNCAGLIRHPAVMLLSWPSCSMWPLSKCASIIFFFSVHLNLEDLFLLNSSWFTQSLLKKSVLWTTGLFSLLLGWQDESNPSSMAWMEVHEVESHLKCIIFQTSPEVDQLWIHPWSEPGIFFFHH